MSTTKSPANGADKTVAVKEVSTQTSAPAPAPVPAAAAPAPVKAAVKAAVKPKAVAKTSVKASSVASKSSAKDKAPAASKSGTSQVSKAAAVAPVKAKAEKVAKDKKPKLVLDSFTIPKVEYTVLDDLKQRSGKLGHAIKKSEILRAGIKALARMTDAGLLAALKDVPAIKTGRPAKD